MLWLLNFLDWQVGTEGRVGCGQRRGPKICQSNGYTTCWLCLVRVGVQGAAWC